MRSWRKVAALAAVGFLVGAAAAHGQERWSVDLRAGAGIPVDDLGEAELEAGPGFEATVAVRLMPHLWVYGGWGWHQLSSDEPLWGPDTDLEQTGYVAGVRWEHPLSGEVGQGPAVRLHAGATAEHLELESGDGELIADTGHGPGWEAGVGLTVPVWGSWRLTPGVRYRALSRELPFDEVTPEVYLEYVAVEVGLSRSF